MKPRNTNNIPDESYLQLLEKVDFTPIFIMGDHRLGTTVFYQTLVANECFNYLNAYHTIKYDEILDDHINGTKEKIRSKNYCRLLKSDRTPPSEVIARSAK